MVHEAVYRRSAETAVVSGLPRQLAALSVADVADPAAMRRAADARHAAERHAPSFLTWLRDPEPAVASRAAALPAAWFPEVPGLATALAGVGFDTGTTRASANLAPAFLPGSLGPGEFAALHPCPDTPDLSRGIPPAFHQRPQPQGLRCDEDIPLLRSQNFVFLGPHCQWGLRSCLRERIGGACG